MHGRLCLPQGAAPKGVMLALHGITYNNQYWDSGFDPGTYSFVRSMTAAGYAVFAVDRIGYGRSFHPLGALNTLDYQAETVHQVIGQLRQGAIGNIAFPDVMLVTHSYGTAVAWLESSRYNDADAIIGTGWNSSAQTVPAARFITDLARSPAPLDPKTRELVGADATYVTSPPGGRGVDYLYDLSNVDPRMIDYDSSVLRDTTSIGEFGTFYQRYSKIPLGQVPGGQELSVPLPAQTQKIRIPVFQLNGANDLFFCGPGKSYCKSDQTLQAELAKHFDPRSCPRAAVTPNAGHDLNLQRNAPYSYNIIRQWADEAVGPDGQHAQVYRSNCRS